MRYRCYAINPTSRKPAAPAMFPVNTSRIPSCLLPCSSSPVHRETLSSAACAWSRSLSPQRSSRLPLFGRRCFRNEGACEFGTEVIRTSGAPKRRETERQAHGTFLHSRLGRPRRPGHRCNLLRERGKDIASVFVFALILDVIYQVISLHTVYPGGRSSACGHCAGNRPVSASAFSHQLSDPKANE